MMPSSGQRNVLNAAPTRAGLAIQIMSSASRGKSPPNMANRQPILVTSYFLHRPPRRAAMRKPPIRPFPPMARWRSIAKSFRSGSLFAPALHHAPEHKLRHGGGSSPRNTNPLGEIHPRVGDRHLPA